MEKNRFFFTKNSVVDLEEVKAIDALGGLVHVVAFRNGGVANIRATGLLNAFLEYRELKYKEDN